jgi:hypothetical protein
MNQPSASFQELFDAALQEYENQTGCTLIEHPLAKQFETCDSVRSITAILQQQTQIFCKFRDDEKLMRSVKSSVDVLYTLSISTVLGEGIGLVCPRSFIGVPFLITILQQFPPAKAIFAGIAILLAVSTHLRSRFYISLTSKFRRRSKTSILATTHSWICLRRLKTSSADSVFTPGSLLRQL